MSNSRLARWRWWRQNLTLGNSRDSSNTNRGWEFCSISFCLLNDFTYIFSVTALTDWTAQVIELRSLHRKEWISFPPKLSQNTVGAKVKGTKHGTNYYSNSVTCARSSLVALVTSKLHVQFTTIPACSDILKNLNFAPLATLITQNLRPKSKL